ncbi:MAG TPA: hypothetical protein VJ783_02285 [Pirellulales bacterium]|nr:hypothetical protein [Pirellulales bacterium]
MCVTINRQTEFAALKRRGLCRLASGESRVRVEAHQQWRHYSHVGTLVLGKYTPGNSVCHTTKYQSAEDARDVLAGASFLSYAHIRECIGRSVTAVGRKDASTWLQVIKELEEQWQCDELPCDGRQRPRSFQRAAGPEGSQARQVNVACKTAYDGTDELFDDWLGIVASWRGTKLPRYKNRSSFKRLRSRTERGPDGLALAQSTLAKIESNWQLARQQGQRQTYESNWEFRQRDEQGATEEVILERRIARLANWGHQMPTVSGLVNSEGRHCNIDLVHKKTDDKYFLFELKVAAENPVAAALQIFRYGMAYVFWRLHARELAYDVKGRPILGARAIHLRVLAPAAYYEADSGSLRWLEESLNDGVCRVANERLSGTLSMDFAFEAFPNWFRLDCSDDELARALYERTAIFHD